MQKTQIKQILKDILFFFFYPGLIKREAWNLESYMKKYKNLINLKNIYDNFNPYKKLIKPEPKL